MTRPITHPASTMAQKATTIALRAAHLCRDNDERHDRYIAVAQDHLTEALRHDPTAKRYDGRVPREERLG